LDPQGGKKNKEEKEINGMKLPVSYPFCWVVEHVPLSSQLLHEKFIFTFPFQNKVNIDT
jgi:hypothetical protein